MTEKDTIPRLHRVVEHTRDQLIGIADGKASFEDGRLRYGETQKRLEREGRGRVTASRVPEHEKNWSPAKEALAELMKIGALKSARLPSARQFVDAYRSATFELTPEGGELAALARSNRGEFTDALAARLIAAHPYLRRLLVTLEDGPIVCPFVTEGDVQRGRDDKFGFEGWGRWGAERIAVDVDPERVKQIVAQHVKRRFGIARQEKPSNKAMSEVLTDAMAVAGFESRGITLDASTIKTLMRWGSDLLLYDQSRYVPDHPDANVVWLACDITTGPDGHPRTARRGFAQHGIDVAHALIRAYEQQTKALDTMLDRPYLPIHQVRAQAAFETNTMRALGDLVLTRLIDGEMPEIGATVIPYIGTSSLPQSEPPFRHHGRRRLEIQVAPGRTNATTPRKERST
jgi:hypothetical protein